MSKFKSMDRTIHDSHLGQIPYSELTPSATESWTSGGTAHYLPQERNNSSFLTEKLCNFLDGGVAGTLRRRSFILAGLEDQYPDGFMEKYDMSRHDLIKRHFEDFIAIHKTAISRGYQPKGHDTEWMAANAVNTGSLMPHMSLFSMTIRGQGSQEQVAAWLPKAMKFEIIGGYAQTELGHGSNIRGLQTTAMYDASTEEFVLNTNTLQGTKWWNSNIGVAATHCTLYAQLVIDGRELGLHVFFVQIRDENHHCLPGVECGDVGVKLGDNAIDTGYMRLLDLRIPRSHMLSKRQHVDPDGTYVKHSSAKKALSAVVSQRMSYLTMMSARAGSAMFFGHKLARGVTTAVRYSAVRHQGFKDNANSGTGHSTHHTHRAPENAILDYQVQQYRLFKWVASAYACLFAGRWVVDKFRVISKELMGGNEDAGEDLPEMHATTSGMKGLLGQIASDGLEDCRKMCGGHGFLLNSGVAAELGDFIWTVTAEGEPIVMLLQSARFLLKTCQAVKRGDDGVETPGLCRYMLPLASKNVDLSELRPEAATAPEHFFSLDYLIRLFEFRAMVSVDRSTARFDEMVGQGTTFDRAWNANALSLTTTAKSHGYLGILSKFRDTCDELRGYDAPVHAVMCKLAAFFGVCNILEGQQWGGILSLNEMQMAEQAAEVLCAALRPDAVALVDAFDYPDRVLNSTLGRHDGNVYESLYDNARSSDLNAREVFDGYTQFLRPHLDLGFLRARSPLAKSRL
jgi:acyl-CoA oxidase